jgi:predicted nucleotidyltransferase
MYHMVEIIQNNIDKIVETCQRHHVKALYLFGSAARTNDFTSESDVDFVVEYNYKDETNDNNVFERVENAEALKEKLKAIIARDIDLVQEKNIRTKFLKYFINKEKKLIYGVS